jgi:xanthine dehydrogenase large subunit
MRFTGKRHAFLAQWEIGVNAEGRILGFSARLWSDGGWSTDLSGPVLDRAMFHLHNAYAVPALRFEGRACRTHLPSATAFRGFGGPQGMLVIEDALNRVAEHLGVDPAEIRRRNLFAEGAEAPYGQVLRDVRTAPIVDALRDSSDYVARRAEIDSFNATSPWVKRGIGLQPVVFGISFTNSVLNQAGALVLVYADGSVQINHGGTEMGQGLHTKVRAVAAHVFGLPPDAVRVMTTATDKVPNTSATAASSGSDLNGQATRIACETVRERMRPIAAGLLGTDDVVFADGAVHGGGRSVAFSALAQQCWADKVSLSATGYYATPGIGYDRDRGRGTPFFYYAYGAAVTEVEVDGRTGQHGVTRIDILHDCGASLVPSIDRGQVEGAYTQGLGWLTVEEVRYDARGRGLTVGPSTYKIPACGDLPRDFRTALWPNGAQDGVIYGSKAVGEPPFMLAIGVVTALRHAIRAYGAGPISLALPATHENVLRAVHGVRAG